MKVIAVGGGGGGPAGAIVHRAAAVVAVPDKVVLVLCVSPNCATSAHSPWRVPFTSTSRMWSSSAYVAE